MLAKQKRKLIVSIESKLRFFEARNDEKAKGSEREREEIRTNNPHKWITSFMCAPHTHPHWIMATPSPTYRKRVKYTKLSNLKPNSINMWHSRMQPHIAADAGANAFSFCCCFDFSLKTVLFAIYRMIHKFVLAAVHDRPYNMYFMKFMVLTQGIDGFLCVCSRQLLCVSFNESKITETKRPKN